jgi:two-component system response regulator NreC
MAHLHLAPTPTETVADPPSSPIRVVLADEHGLVRRSLRLLLDGEQDLEVIAEAHDLPSALGHVGGEPCVLVLDRRIAAGPGEQAAGPLRARALATRVVILSMQESPVFAQRTLSWGALGFVLKDRADEELPCAIRAAARGQEYVSPQIAQRLDVLRRSFARA